MADFVRRFFSHQVNLCRRFDERFFKDMAVDGNEEFSLFVRRAVGAGYRVADIGGGKTPFFNVDEIRSKMLRVTGVDIDLNELAQAPRGSYQNLHGFAIEVARGHSDHDLVIAQSILEHVRDGALAAHGIASFGRFGGAVVTFCPSRRAWFARLNLLLPERVKRAVLFYIFPSKRDRQGFPAYYDACTPRELVANMQRAGVACTELRPYFTSSYFMFFFPLYLFWRALTFPLMRLWPMYFCETFMFVGQISER